MLQLKKERRKSHNKTGKKPISTDHKNRKENAKAPQGADLLKTANSKAAAAKAGKMHQKG